jgi:hypothetical protein
MHDLKIFKDKHKGEKAFLVATGPSLRITDLDLIKTYTSFSCNKIYLAYESTDWRCDYYSVIDRLVAQNNAEEISEKIDSIKILSGVVKEYLPDNNHTFWLRDLPSPVIDGVRQAHFSTDISHGTYGGYTVVYTLMQIAYYMGIKELFLLGLDFSFDKSAPSGKATSAGEEILVQNNEVNHFHPDYRKKGDEWTVPRLDIQYDAFKCAKQAFEKEGRKIFNASRFTKLDVFPRVNLEDII